MSSFSHRRDSWHLFCCFVGWVLLLRSFLLGKCRRNRKDISLATRETVLYVTTLGYMSSLVSISLLGWVRLAEKILFADKLATKPEEVKYYIGSLHTWLQV